MREFFHKNVIAVLFVSFMAIGFIKNGSYTQFDSLAKYLASVQANKDGEYDADKEIETIDNSYASSMWKHRSLIDLNGKIAEILNIRGLYNDIGIYITKDRYIVSPDEETSTDHEYLELTGLYKFLNDKGINLLYVNKPVKYIDDSLFEREFGVETYSNRNADKLIQRIKAEGIPVADLRENIRAENLNVSDMFYRTDHHWTTRTGLWSAQKIAQALNDDCGYGIDIEIYDIDNFRISKWNDCWLGEQGGKIGESYVGLDGFEEIKPDHDTAYVFKIDDGNLFDGTFDDFIDEAYYELENNQEHNLSWHYSYKTRSCINKNVAYGKILMLGDSYDMVLEPFLSLGVHEIDYVDLRQVEEGFNLMDYIEQGDYDTVLICYTQFMIGAHDDPESSNYRCFDFD